jgi:hypothetical protein
MNNPTDMTHLSYARAPLYNNLSNMAVPRVDGQAVSGDFNLLSMEGSSDGPTDCLDFIHCTSEVPGLARRG